jgi:amino-acid N-acetyltransferase
MSTPVTASIRHATRGDLPAIERLLTESDLPTAGVAEIVNARPDDFFVAETNDAARQLVAVAGVEVCRNEALLRSVAVQAEWRGHRLGHELVRRIVGHAEERGMRALYLLTTTADRYFPRFGFERVERSVVPPEIADTLEFKSTCPASAVAMKRAITAGAR